MARIMVVEDDVYMREELTDLLRKSGYETASLFDFENAIPEITEYSPDLVLLDINLPFHSGFEICKELKAKQLGTVLVLTASRIRHNSLSKAKSALLYRQLHLPVSFDLRCHS